jgi:hypothetical protein
MNIKIMAIAVCLLATSGAFADHECAAAMIIPANSNAPIQYMLSCYKDTNDSNPYWYAYQMNDVSTASTLYWIVGPNKGSCDKNSKVKYCSVPSDSSDSSQCATLNADGGYGYSENIGDYESSGDKLKNWSTNYVTFDSTSKYNGSSTGHCLAGPG